MSKEALVKVAMPVFNGRIAPVFDWAQRLLVVDHDGKAEKARQEVSLVGIGPHSRPGHLERLGVQVLLCGGISAPIGAMIESHGVKLIPGLAGEVDALLKAYVAGTIPDPAFTMPGWRWYGPGPLKTSRAGYWDHGYGRGRGGADRGGGWDRIDESGMGRDHE